MLNPGATLKASAAPVPQPFQPEADPEYHRHIEILGRAVDELVGAYVQLLVTEADSDHADVRRLAAAARRLWTLAAEMRRAGRSPF